LIKMATRIRPVSLLGHQWNKKADSIALKSETVYTDLSYCTKRKALGMGVQKGQNYEHKHN
jgi:hypothetical protein